MKQKDIALIAIVVFISAIASTIISNILITSPKNRKAQVEVVESLSSQFKEPDKIYFNKDAVDPTKLIEIGNNSNPAPFH
ncbi:hypothetical protein HY218_01425 [Candidatus Saccharibacteria bacterium]|nr:hypothetical protein [Candidatus Saccharibacteria bacterium]